MKGTDIASLLNEREDIWKMTDIRMGARWCRKEDEELAELVVDLNQNWGEIAQNFEKRSAKMCENRWNQVISLGLIKGKWTIEEDSIIKESMRHGILKWSEIAKRLPGNRVGKQCRERWCNHLDPSLKKTPWTEEEDAIMFREQGQIGNSWTKIALLIPGRSENEVKNRFNSTIRKRKLLDSNCRSEFSAPTIDTSDDELDNRNEEDVYHDQRIHEAALPARHTTQKKMRTESHTFRTSPSNNYPTIPQGYSIISLSKDDLKALHLAERLLKKLVQMDSPISPLYVNQLMSLLSLTHMSDFASTFASLNMIPITNIADHESPTTPASTISSATSTEFETQDCESHDSLRVDIGRSYGMYNQPPIQHLKSKKLSNVFKKSFGENHLWAPAEDQVESKRFKSSSISNVNPASTSTFSSSSVLSLSYGQQRPVTSFTPIQPTPRSPCGSHSRDGLKYSSGSGNDSRPSPTPDASLPVDYNEGNINKELWTNHNHTIYLKNEEVEHDRDIDDEDAVGDKDIPGRSADSPCNSPFSLFEELTCSSPSWDCFSPAYNSQSGIPSASHSPTPIQAQTAGPGILFPSQCLKSSFTKKKSMSNSNLSTPIQEQITQRDGKLNSFIDDLQKPKYFSRSTSCSCMSDRGSVEDDIVVEALRMLSGSSRAAQKSNRGSGASSVSGGYNFFNPSDGGDTDYMSSFSLSTTPFCSRPQSPTRLVLDDPSLILPCQMDGLKMNTSYFSLSTTPWSSRPESPEDFVNDPSLVKID